METPLTEYMYCAKYGGFGFSHEFVDEYKKRYGKKIHTMYVDRADPDAIALFKERGQYQTCGGYNRNTDDDDDPRLLCAIALAKVPTKYLDHIGIHEYDGLESVYIDHDAYIIDKLKRTDPADSEAIAALIEEAITGPEHPGENMSDGKTEYWNGMTPQY